MKRIWLYASALALGAAAVALAPATAEAQITRVSRGDTNQAIGFNIGYFGVRGEDARIADDVLLVDLDDLAFDVSDFNGGTLAAEYLVGIGDYLEAGVGAGFYRRTVPSVYRGLTFESGEEIEQDLRLRMIPVTATVRFLPAGRGGAVEPYVGAGIGFFNWRYSETGEFVDPFTDEIFRNRYVADGNAVGPVLLAGLRAPVGDVWTVGGELRYQRAEGDLNSSESGLLTDKIDLGGWSANFTFGFRF
jgi:outer membrane protein W